MRSQETGSNEPPTSAVSTDRKLAHSRPNTVKKSGPLHGIHNPDGFWFAVSSAEGADKAGWMKD
jgi:hypothetical protein